MHATQENFPVALRVLPGRYRRPLQAVYAFARLVDDIGDEAADPSRGRSGQVAAELAAISSDLDRIYAGWPAADPALAGLADVVSARRLPREPFDALIAANLQDQRVSDYATREELLDYCRLSANPVGELVLRIFGVTPSRDQRALSDDVCTGLQLVEHWQDVGEDARRGRVYLPAADRNRYGVEVEDLLADRAGERLRALMGHELAWAEELLRRGSALVGLLSGWARPAVAGYAAGGLAAVDGLRARAGDPLSGPSPVRRRDTARHAVRMLRKGRA